jgi:hypothetical protein
LSSDRQAVYQGTVINNADPLAQGRLIVSVPQVLGTANSNWAEPQAKYPTISIPPANSSVWVMFIGGDKNRPIYFWDPTPLLLTMQAQIAALEAR